MTVETERAPGPSTGPEPLCANGDTDAGAAIAAQIVHYVYPGRRRTPRRVALKNVTLSIEPGQRVALLGPNGSGKSTLLKIIATALNPTTGAVRVFGDDRDAARGRLGVVFQSPALDRHLSVRRNLVDAALLYGVSAADAETRMIGLLKRMGMMDRINEPVKTLSGGLARRADLCRALLHAPTVLLLDEPTTGLDPSARRQFLDQLDDLHAERDLTILMTTHLTDEAERMDRVVLMHEGRLVADDAPGELRRTLGARQVVVSDAAWSPAREALPGEWERSFGGWRTSVESDDELASLIVALAREGVAFSVAPPSLGDVFEHLTGARLERQSHTEEPR